ncbi:Metallo-dependent phosphatase [Ophiobolus disseminans]|uniref:Metallo-dependent phosphatase n=1 Tax=Ophiobolus disseminans TaxID=1469910 RepID=A0A6A6ZWJ5_9PLEO|nr:Metallo-dependent phosphatase [Ophiobolus disseminans]
MATRKTRIICISDTHNQTPRLPAGDVLIHAGDLTNQGSYSELEKTVRWLEGTDFEAKIVIAGNHEITLDAPFHAARAGKFKWSEPQDPAKCRQLLTSSPSITYLENSHAKIYLTSPLGPRTCFKVFGSPYSRGQRGWAFQYWDGGDAEKLWRGIDADADVVVVHAPAYGHVDKGNANERTGCEVLGRRLGVVRPRMFVCGHIHGARGVERVRWKERMVDGEDTELVEDVEYWTDPGKGNKKMSLLDLTSKSGRALENDTGALPRHEVPYSLRDVFRGADTESEGPQPDAISSSLETSALDDNEALWRRKRGGAVQHSDVGCGEVDAHSEVASAGSGKAETAMINAAFLGPRIAGKAMEFNKPIVVDIDLPVWHFAASS